MYNKIIVPLSLEHGYASKALGIARKLKSAGGSIIAVHVLEPLHSSVKAYVPQEHLAEFRQAAENEMAQRIGDDKEIESVLLIGNTGLAVTEYADEVGADCIVVGSHKPGLEDYLLGSTAARIVRHAPCSVHVLR